jgi:uncharacterized protein YegJ (DUF2314 family)
MALWMLGCGQAGDETRPPGDSPHTATTAPARPDDMTLRLATYDADGFELDDGESLHAAAPVTFSIPDAERRRGLRAGDIVKLVFRMRQDGTDTPSVERMWVKVAEVRGGSYVGALDNDPVGDVRVRAGDRVVFEARHVIDVYGE